MIRPSKTRLRPRTLSRVPLAPETILTHETYLFSKCFYADVVLKLFKNIPILI